RPRTGKGEVGMSGTRMGLAGLVATVLGLGAVRAQPPAPALPPPPPGVVVPEVADHAGPPLLPSRWVLYDRGPGCCGPVSVTGADLNPTYVYVAAGREWYLWGAAEHDCGRNWRVGADVGGTYGSEKLDLNETRHLTDTTAGIFVSVHSDLECPWGQIIVQAG